MSSPKTVEENVLQPAFDLIGCFVETIPAGLRKEARLTLLEEVSADLAGLDRATLVPSSTECGVNLAGNGETRAALTRLLLASPVHPTLALASLARPELTFSQARQEGSYFTDFRLAAYLAQLLPESARKGKLVDPACGSGSLLAAAVLRLFPRPSKQRDKYLAHCIFGTDLSADAIRSARLVLSSLAIEPGTVTALTRHLVADDSLTMDGDQWADQAAGGFDFVIGNPPWERLKITRHELLKAAGQTRHYGQSYGDTGLGEALQTAKDEMQAYLSKLSTRFELQGSGEADTYKLFLELSLRLIKPQGGIAMLVPAGLIRSKGTERLRRFLWENFEDLEFAVLQNRSRFFAIDTRFKFLAMRGYRTPSGTKKPIRLSMPESDGFEVRPRKPVSISRRTLNAIRPDLSLPEVRSAEEWKLFARLNRIGVSMAATDSPWHATYLREVDMTSDRAHFVPSPNGRNEIPLIEGRMVHQYSFGAKKYIRGSGRKAIWERHFASTLSDLQPQFYFPPSELGEQASGRILRDRVGFCDITGQTNERSFLASIIPAGAVCGNKVPTLIFSDKDDARALLWLGIANSITFDWIVRRVITTTVNFFMLRALPMPVLSVSESVSKRIIEAVETIRQLGGNPADWKVANQRLRIEMAVFEAYDCNMGEIKLMLNDFPLLDRGEPPLPAESKSTVTRDSIMAAALADSPELSGPENDFFSTRVSQARELGAIPFMPSHLR